MVNFKVYVCGFFFQEYEFYYEMEEEINRQLNVFLVNMRVVYGGFNIVEVQIDYNFNVGMLVLIYIW